MWTSADHVRLEEQCPSTWPGASLQTLQQMSWAQPHGPDNWAWPSSWATIRFLIFPQSQSLGLFSSIYSTCPEIHRKVQRWTPLQSLPSGSSQPDRKPDKGKILKVLNIFWWKVGNETRLPWWLSSREPTCQCRRHGFNPWVRKIPWRRKWQPTPVFLPGESHAQRSLGGYSPWGLRVRHNWSD